MEKLDFNKFDWGGVSEKFKAQLIKEINTELYESVFPVEEGDVVVDVGAFVGDFTYSILHKNPEHCWVIEPVEYFFRVMYKNLKNHQVSFVHGGLSERPIIQSTWHEKTTTSRGFLFEEFVKENCIDKIDFLKTDCEGGEYFIFTEENFDFIKNNVKKIAGEFHLRTQPYSATNFLKERFRFFRDHFLKKFDNYKVFALDGVDIKWDLFNEHFLEYYQEVMIYIDNR